jgi:hypothetical protein
MRGMAAVSQSFVNAGNRPAQRIASGAQFALALQAFPILPP